jgi:hypothetical protein
MTSFLAMVHLLHCHDSPFTFLFPPGFTALPDKGGNGCVQEMKELGNRAKVIQRAASLLVNVDKPRGAPIPRGMVSSKGDAIRAQPLMDGERSTKLPDKCDISHRNDDLYAAIATARYVRRNGELKASAAMVICVEIA